MKNEKLKMKNCGVTCGDGLKIMMNDMCCMSLPPRPASDDRPGKSDAKSPKSVILSEAQRSRRIFSPPSRLAAYLNLRSPPGKNDGQAAASIL